MISKRLLLTATVITIGLLVAAGAQADLIGTYVGPTTSNTTGAVNQPFDTTTSSGTDNLWRDRSDLPGSSAGVVDRLYEALDTENNELTTTFTIPDAGLYDIYVVYASNHSNPASFWGIAAGMSDADTLYDDGDNFNAGIDTGLTVLDVPIYQAKLGTVTVGAGGSVSIHVDTCMLLDPTPSLERTWYYGAAYEVVPEPSTLVLLSIGGGIGLLLLWRRRE